MRVLTLYCHPTRESFIGALLGDVEAALREPGHEMDLLDLYARAFDPALSAQELREYWTPAADDDEHARRLRAADALIAIYPTWWYTLPARLKGYFDRVWRPGVAFTLTDGAIAGALTNIKRLLIITTYGSSQDFVQNEIGDPGALLWRNGFARLCAPNCDFDYCALYGMDASTAAERAIFRARVEERLGRFR